MADGCEESKDLIRDLRALVRTAKAISSLLDVQQQLPVILDAALELTSADRAIFFLFDESGQLQPQVKQGHRRRKTGDIDSYSKSVVDRVVNSGEPVFILADDIDSEVELSPSIRALSLRTVMCTALHSRFGLIGALYVDSTSPLRAFSARQQEVFQALADHAAVAVENARLYSLSISDPLTGLYNHAYFHRRLAEEISRADRYSRSIALLLLDIDRFKNINDTLGHRAGDGVLSRLAKVLRHAVRDCDIVARYGGDEFAIIAPETGAPSAAEEETARIGAEIMAQRIRRLVEQDAPTDSPHVTVSIGVAQFPADCVAGGAELIELADRALYGAKDSGRNTVVCARHLHR